MVAAPGTVRRNSWVSIDNAMLVGMSAGGFAVIETGATNPPATDTQGAGGYCARNSDEAAAIALKLKPTKQRSTEMYALRNKQSLCVEGHPLKEARTCGWGIIDGR